MQIIPLQDYVVIEEKQVESTAGIILPEDADMEATGQGTIVALPDNTLQMTSTFYKPPYAEGSQVLFKRHTFDEFEVDGKKVLLGRQEHIIAVLKPC